jgi:hypothetical protein
VYVTMHSYRIQAGTPLDVALEGQHFAGTVAQIPGFRAYYIVDGGDDCIGAVGIFDTIQGIEECDRLAAEFVKSELGDFRLSEVQVTEGQVLASRWDGAPAMPAPN